MQNTARRWCEALNLLIRTTPLHIGDDQFVVCAITDISVESDVKHWKRCSSIDLLNEATCLKLLSDYDPRKNAPEQFVKIKKSVTTIIDEIKAQRDLAAAEHGELILRKESIPPRSNC